MVKKTLRETLTENAKALEDTLKMYGKEPPAGYNSLLVAMENKPKRAASVPSGKVAVPLEADISKAVSQYLAVHPKVKFSVRQNSGAAMMTGKGGAQIPVWFYRFSARKGVEMRITDYWGMLTDGRMFAIEVKRQGWTKPTDQREREQANFIEVVGLGGFVTCIEDVERILK